jgi:hypothetical protein
MTVQNRNQQDETQANDAKGETPLVPTGKKEFVEPEISQPVDVLEATTFFQAIDSGPTG